VGDQPGFQLTGSFFPDLDAAVAEAARVTREGGRDAGSVWLPIDRSPYMGAQRAAIEADTEPQSIETFSAAFASRPSASAGRSPPRGSAGPRRARRPPRCACPGWTSSSRGT
jgi:hypothetical protein